MGKWENAATWIGGGLRREVFFFGPEQSRLYGSLYSAESPSREDGVLVCPSWGFEADRTEHLAHHTALTIARLGGAGMVFHYPGFGDSHGASPGDATIDSLALAAVSALEEATRRRPGLAWFPAGLMIGAAVACMALRASEVAANRLLLVQPSLRPSAYFDTLARHVQRVDLETGGSIDVSFAYPFPRRIVDAGEDADVPVIEALREFDGEGAIVRHVRPARDEWVPESLVDITVEGPWRYAAKDNRELERGVAEWLRR